MAKDLETGSTAGVTAPIQQLELTASVEAAERSSGPPALTVTELTAQIRAQLEGRFQEVWVQGELSNFRPAPSGHLYFTLKDGQSQISAALFGWGSKKARVTGGVDLKEGLLVLCKGRVTVYGPRGSYQLTVDRIEPLGAGALQVAFEQLKARLGAEGLFDPQVKRKLPYLPKRIAIVTSPTGAAIQDMLNVLRRRAPGLHVTVVPSLVQGPEAAQQIRRGLEAVGRTQFAELVVLARGGGSIEDLWSFNDEELVRAIRRSPVPVISAVGHEIDFTLSDFCADLRAPTPSAAAEILSQGWFEASQRVAELTLRKKRAWLQGLNQRKLILGQIAAHLRNPRDRLREQAQKLDEAQLRLNQSVGRALDRRKALLAQLSASLHAFSPLQVLDRGYAFVREARPNGIVIQSRAQVQSGSELTLIFKDGETRVRAL